MSLRKKMLYLLIFFLAAALPLALAKEARVQGRGANREEAVNDALRLSVEQAVGTLVSSETLVENYQVVKDEIYAHSRGFVNGFEILGEKRQPDGTYSVDIKAEVDTNPSSALVSQLQRLNLIKHGLQDPRIAVIIPETYAKARVRDPAGESAVIQKLLEAGFTRIVDSRHTANLKYGDTLKALLLGDRATARAAGARLNADYLLVGEAASEYIGPVGGGILSCRARLDARLIKADTGDIVAANGIQAGGVDITEIIAAKKSLQNAGEKMGEYMVEKLMGYAGNLEKGIKLTVTGIPSFSKVTELEKGLRGLMGVKNVYIRDYSGGVALLELDATVTAQMLSASFSGLGATGLMVTEISGSAIKAALRY